MGESVKGKRLLIARTDALGDVLLSLPALEAARRSLPNAEIHLLIQPLFIPLLQNLLREWGIHPIAYRKRSASEWSGLLSKLELDALVILQSGAELHWGALAAAIPLRVGNFSKAHSLATLTHGIKQSRSRGEKNEGEYCADLVHHLLKIWGVEEKPPIATRVLPMNAEARNRARTILQEVGVQSPYVVLHPGMRGSALNLSAAAYARLAARLRKLHDCPIVVTVGPQDERLAEELRGLDAELRFIRGLSLSELAEIFRAALRVIAPSTGPLHLAHRVGTETLGLYSPVRAHQARRWSPWGGAAPVQTLTPRVACPGLRRCEGSACPEFSCMERFPWEHEVKTPSKHIAPH